MPWRRPQRTGQRLHLTFREERILWGVLHSAQGPSFLGLSSLEASRKTVRTDQEDEKKPEPQNPDPAVALLWGDRLFVLKAKS